MNVVRTQSQERKKRIFTIRIYRISTWKKPSHSRRSKPGGEQTVPTGARILQPHTPTHRDLTLNPFENYLLLVTTRPMNAVLNPLWHALKGRCPREMELNLPMNLRTASFLAQCATHQGMHFFKRRIPEVFA